MVILKKGLISIAMMLFRMTSIRTDTIVQPTSFTITISACLNASLQHFETKINKQSLMGLHFNGPLVANLVKVTLSLFLFIAVITTYDGSNVVQR